MWWALPSARAVCRILGHGATGPGTATPEGELKAIDLRFVDLGKDCREESGGKPPELYINTEGKHWLNAHALSTHGYNDLCHMGPWLLVHLQCDPPAKYYG